MAVHAGYFDNSYAFPVEKVDSNTSSAQARIRLEDKETLLSIRMVLSLESAVSRITLSPLRTIRRFPWTPRKSPNPETVRCLMTFPYRPLRRFLSANWLHLRRCSWKSLLVRLIRRKSFRCVYCPPLVREELRKFCVLSINFVVKNLRDAKFKRTS